MLSLVAILLVGCNRPATSPYPGGSAPTVDVVDAGGLPWVLGEPSGRRQLIGFSTPWCGPCRQEEPQLLALLGTHGDRVDYTRVNGSPGPPAQVEAVAPPLPGRQVWDADGLAFVQYEVDGLPLSVVLDGDGLVVYRGTQLPTEEDLLGEQP